MELYCWDRKGISSLMYYFPLRITNDLSPDRFLHFSFRPTQLLSYTATLWTIKDMTNYIKYRISKIMVIVIGLTVRFLIPRRQIYRYLCLIPSVKFGIDKLITNHQVSKFTALKFWFFAMCTWESRLKLCIPDRLLTI